MRVLEKSERLVENELYVVVHAEFPEDYHLLNQVGRCVTNEFAFFQKLMIENSTFFYDYECGDRVATFDNTCRRATADACSE